MTTIHQINKNKLGLSWAKLSPGWGLIDFSFVDFG